ncbi:hypothetical protein N752_13000 [Desulforamulus aquiferis]|nr:hypothetical protein N752_13000 [Desulforamulus aquiferis]
MRFEFSLSVALLVGISAPLVQATNDKAIKIINKINKIFLIKYYLAKITYFIFLG